MARQQSGWLACRVPSKQADAGIVAEKTTTASTNKAPFLHNFMVYRTRVSIEASVIEQYAAMIQITSLTAAERDCLQ